MSSAAVIIPTTGRESLKKAYDSVVNQSYTNVDPIVVADGVKEFGYALHKIRRDPEYKLHFNTGANYFNGHRIYGALPFLLPHDYIFYLDDDNEFHPDHVAKCMDLCLSRGLDWCYSFREMYDGDTFVCNDECESLGKWPVWYNGKAGHIDTSCFCIKREVAVQIAPVWHRPSMVDGKPVTSTDTLVANELMRRFPAYDCTRSFTVKCRLGTQDQSPKGEFFKRGNEAYRQMCPEGLPWA
jgi:hypothetical protein